MWGLVLVVAGLALSGFGVRLALERPRPVNLLGMLLAPAGLALALLGLGRVLSPGFLFSEGGRPVRAALRLMPAGDGRTAGTGNDGGWRAPLWRDLARAGRTVDFVGTAHGGPSGIDRDHESWEGITIEGLAGHLATDLPALLPEVILLHVGTHDLTGGATPEVLGARLAALLDAAAAAAPRTRILVATLAGVRAANAYRLRPETVAVANARIRAVVAERARLGRPVALVEMQAVGRAAADFGEDGLHLNERGAAEMAQRWLEAVRGLP
jgi:lysophospholipase L1-like esterase